VIDLSALEAEGHAPLAQMEVEAFGPAPYFRVCRNGHEITSRWDDDPHRGCIRCERIARNRRACGQTCGQTAP
jgi:hypothetical protein